MFCNNCGSQLDHNEKYCVNCGSENPQDTDAQNYAKVTNSVATVSDPPKKLDGSTVLALGIVALALILFLRGGLIPALIISIIALKKAKAFKDHPDVEGAKLANIGKIFATVTLIISIVVLAILLGIIMLYLGLIVFYIIFYVLAMVGMGAIGFLAL